ncbi:hypothetical protein NMY22_g14745 [Coprinellus aureogranulatus]|nr:hypothetical protein NMY22_g14745 [Coprinellus aureogranulatus]
MDTSSDISERLPEPSARMVPNKDQLQRGSEMQAKTEEQVMGLLDRLRGTLRSYEALMADFTFLKGQYIVTTGTNHQLEVRVERQSRLLERFAEHLKKIRTEDPLPEDEPHQHTIPSAPATSSTIELFDITSCHHRQRIREIRGLLESLGL